MIEKIVCFRLATREKRKCFRGFLEIMFLDSFNYVATGGGVIVFRMAYVLFPELTDLTFAVRFFFFSCCKTWRCNITIVGLAVPKLFLGFRYKQMPPQKELNCSAFLELALLQLHGTGNLLPLFFSWDGQRSFNPQAGKPK